MDSSKFLGGTILTSRRCSLRAQTDMHYAYFVQETPTEISHKKNKLKKKKKKNVPDLQCNCKLPLALFRSTRLVATPRQRCQKCFVLIRMPNSIPKRRNYSCLALQYCGNPQVISTGSVQILLISRSYSPQKV